jgi:hypothetical protein
MTQDFGLGWVVGGDFSIGASSLLLLFQIIRRFDFAI